MKKGTPKRNGSGKGTGANSGRGGCATPKKPNQEIRGFEWLKKLNNSKV